MPLSELQDTGGKVEFHGLGVTCVGKAEKIVTHECKKKGHEGP
jgi:hypothetical protein